MGSNSRNRGAETPPDYDYELVGRRFGIRRRQFGWSVEELARRAEVSRDTIMRLEQGKSARYSTIRRVRAKLQFFSEQLTKNDQESALYAVSRAIRNRWLVGKNRDRRGREVNSTDFLYVDEEAERRRQAGLGYQPFFTSLLRSEMPDGVMGQAIMEIYDQSPVDRHFGEEFIYCLEGTLELKIEDEICILGPGDSMLFDAIRPHRYAPGPASGKHSPVKILVVVAIRPDEDARMKALDNPRQNWGV